MRTLGWAASAALLLATTAAAAPRPGQPPRYTGDLSGFSRNPEDLPRIVDAAEAHGGQVLEARYDGHSGAAGYDLVVRSGRGLQFLQVDQTRPGAVVVSGTRAPGWMLTWRAKRERRTVSEARIRLADAIRRAEAAHGGAPAVAAGVARGTLHASNGVPAYNVLLLVGDNPRRVAIDAETGREIADPQALRGWP